MRAISSKVKNLRIFLFNMKSIDKEEKFVENLNYSPTIYHLKWLHDNMKNIVVHDGIIILHRLIRFWRLIIL